MPNPISTHTAANCKKTLTLTQGLADAFTAYARRYNLNESQLLRQAIAHEIGYNLAADPQVVRPGRYSTPTAAQIAKNSQDSARNRSISNIRAVLRDRESAAILDSLLR